MSARRGLMIGLCCLVFVAPLRDAQSAGKRQVGLEEVLRLTEKTSPDIQSASELEKAERSSVTIARSGYLPHLELDAIDSTGFPGSSGRLGLGGLVASPYRGGAAAGFVATQTVWDFGRTSWAVEAARRSADAQKYASQVLLLDLDREAAREFFTCVKYRDEVSTWEFVRQQADLVAREVNKFVSTGQRSIVERYLVQAEVDQATTAIGEFQERSNEVLQRIGTLTRLDWKTISCPDSAILRDPAQATSNTNYAELNPRIKAVRAQSESLRAEAERAKSERNPKLLAMGSVGAMAHTHLIEKGDYSASVGLSFPIFEGLRTQGEISRAEALSAAKEYQVEGERDRVDLINDRFDEAIQSASVRMRYLGDEVALDDKAFSLAKKRYLSLQGTLVDVREALRNLTLARTQMIEARSAYFEATYAKALFNGWRPR